MTRLDSDFSFSIALFSYNKSCNFCLLNSLLYLFIGLGHTFHLLRYFFYLKTFLLHTFVVVRLD